MSAPRRAWFAWVAICIVWGTTFYAIKIGLETMPPFLLGGFRFLIAGVLLAAFVRARGDGIPALSDWTPLAIQGFFMLLGGNGGVSWGVQFVPSGLAAVLIGMTPFWMVGIDAVLSPGRQLHVQQWTGLAVGFTGIAILVWPDLVKGGVDGRHFALGVAALQGSCVAWSIGTAYTRRHVVRGNALAAAAVQMICGGLFMIVVGSLAGEWSRLGFSGRSVSALVYLVTVGSLVGYVSFSYALQYLDVAIVSLYTYINPIIAVALGTLLLDEPFHSRMVAAGAIIAVGVWLVRRSSRSVA